MFFTSTLLLLSFPLIIKSNLCTTDPPSDPTKYLYTSGTTEKCTTTCPSVGFFPKNIVSTNSKVCQACPSKNCVICDNDNLCLNYCDALDQRTEYHDHKGFTNNNVQKYCHNIVNAVLCNRMKIRLDRGASTSGLLLLCTWDPIKEVCGPTQGYKDQTTKAGLNDRFCCNQCTSCTHQMYKYLGECYKSCNSWTTTYPVPTATNKGWICKECSVEIAQCNACTKESSELVCTSCKVGYSLSADGKTCLLDTVAPSPAGTSDVAPTPAPISLSPTPATPAPASSMHNYVLLQTNVGCGNANAITILPEFSQTNTKTNTVSKCAGKCSATNDCVAFAFGKNARANDCVLYKAACDSAYNPQLNWNQYRPKTEIEMIDSIDSEMLSIDTSEVSDTEKLRRVQFAVDQLALSLFVNLEINGPQVSVVTDRFVLVVRSTTGMSTAGAAARTEPIVIGSNGLGSTISFPPNFESTALSKLSSDAVVDVQAVVWKKNIYSNIIASNTRKGTRLLAAKEEATFLLRTGVTSVMLWHEGERLNINNTSKVMTFTFIKQNTTTAKSNDSKDSKDSTRRRRTATATATTSVQNNYTCLQTGQVLSMTCPTEQTTNRSFGYEEKMISTTLLPESDTFSLVSCSKDMIKVSLSCSFVALIIFILGIVYGVLFRDWNFEYLRTLCCCNFCPGNCVPKNGREGNRPPTVNYAGNTRGAMLIRARIAANAGRRQTHIAVTKRAYLGDGKRTSAWEKKRKYYNGGLLYLTFGAFVFCVLLQVHNVTCLMNNDIVEGIYALSFLSIVLTYTFGGVFFTCTICTCCRSCQIRKDPTPNTTRQKRKDYCLPLLCYFLFLLVPVVGFNLMNMYQNQINVFGSRFVGGQRVTPENVIAIQEDGKTICKTANVTVRMDCNMEATEATEATDITDKDESNKVQRSALTECVFFNELTQDWSNTGCQLIKEDETTITCACTHLTDFSAGLGETKDVLGRVFTPNYVDKLFVVHWYVVLLIFLVLGCFIVLGIYGNSYDKRVWRRESMEGVILASLVAAKMLRKLKSSKFYLINQKKKKMARASVISKEVHQLEELEKEIEAKEENIQLKEEQLKRDSKPESTSKSQEEEKKENEKFKRAESSQSKTLPERTIVVAVQPVRPEAVSVGIPAYRLSTTGTFASTPRLSPTTMNQPWYKEYRRVSMYTQMNDLSVAEIDEDDRQMNCIEKLLSCPRLICTYMCCRCCNKLMFVFWHRLLHEHDIFELFFVNNRWYTRTHRTMVLLTRIGGKFAVCGLFFLWSRNFGRFSDVVTGEIDWVGKFVAVLCSFTTNKTLGSMFRGLFVFLSHRHRHAVYHQFQSHKNALKEEEKEEEKENQGGGLDRQDSLKGDSWKGSNGMQIIETKDENNESNESNKSNAISNQSSNQSSNASSSASSSGISGSSSVTRYPSIVNKTIDRTLMRMEAEAIIAKSRGEYDAGKCMNPCLTCLCRSCTNTHCGRVTTDIVVWCISIFIVGFLLFFCIGFGFALQNEEKVRAWLQSSFISIGIWFLVTRPLTIFIKSILQLHGKQMQHDKRCCCLFTFCNCICRTHLNYNNEENENNNNNKTLQNVLDYILDPLDSVATVQNPNSNPNIQQSKKGQPAKTAKQGKTSKKGRSTLKREQDIDDMQIEMSKIMTEHSNHRNGRETRTKRTKKKKRFTKTEDGKEDSGEEEGERKEEVSLGTRPKDRFFVDSPKSTFENIIEKPKKFIPSVLQDNGAELAKEEKKKFAQARRLSLQEQIEQDFLNKHKRVFEEEDNQVTSNNTIAIAISVDSVTSIEERRDRRKEETTSNGGSEKKKKKKKTKRKSIVETQDELIF